MQLLTFHANEERYAIKTSKIREVLPVAKLKDLPFTHSCIAGLLNYRGTAVPVVDMNILVSGKPARLLMSTRMIIFKFQVTENDERPLALLAEQATEIMQYDKSQVQDYGLNMDEAQFLGEIIYTNQGMIQLVDPEKLISDSLKGTLFKTLEDTDANSTDVASHVKAS